MDLTRAVVDAKDSCQELTDSCKEMSDSCQELADSYKSLQAMAMAAELLSSLERFKVQQAAATSSRTTTTTPPPTSTTPPPTTTTTPPPTSTTPPPTPPPQATPTPEETPTSYSIPTMSSVAPHTATAVILQLPARCSTLGVAHDAGSIDDKVALVEPATVEAWPTIALQFWVQHVPAPSRPLVHPRQGPPKNPVPAGDCDSRCFDDNGRLFLTSSFRPSIDAIERGDFSPWKNAKYIGRCLPDNLSSLSPGRYKTMRLIELQHLGVNDMGSLWDSIAKNWLVTVIIVARQACDGLKNSTADAIHSITVFFLPHKILELVSSRPPGPPTNCSKRNAFSRVNNGWQSMHLVMNNFLLWRHIDFILKEVGVFAIQVQSMAVILMRPWDPGVVDLFSMNILLVHWNILRADSKPEIQVTSWCSITCSEWPSPNSCFQYYFQNVHVQRYGHVTSIRAPSATCCFCLLHVAAKQWTNLQKMQPIGVQIALLLHLLVPLQQNHGGWVLLRRILPTAQQLLHGTIGVERVSVTGSYLAMIAACFLYAEIMQSNASSREHVVATHNKLNGMVLCGMPKEESCICARASVQLIGQSGDVSRIRPNLRRPFVPEFLCIKLQEGQLTSDQINGSLMIMPAPEANDVNALDNSEFNSFLSARPANHLHGSAIAICPRAIPNNCQQHLMVTSFNVPWFSVYGFLQFGKLHVIMIWDPDIKKCFMGIPYYPGNTIGVCPSACRANVVQQYMTSYHLYTWASYITHQGTTPSLVQLENLFGGSHQTAVEVGSTTGKYFGSLELYVSCGGSSWQVEAWTHVFLYIKYDAEVVNQIAAEMLLHLWISFTGNSMIGSICLGFYYLQHYVHLARVMCLVHAYQFFNIDRKTWDPGGIYRIYLQQSLCIELKQVNYDKDFENSSPYVQTCSLTISHLKYIPWPSMLFSWTTLENKSKVMGAYEIPSAWGQAEIQDEGNVT